MGTVSLCMIVRDEEDVLGRCLDSVKDLVDEIIIVDTGSHDRTKEIARQYTEKIFDFPWIDDFSAARNFSFDKASCAYCMWLDADDILLQEDRERFKELKEELAPEVKVVMMPYHVGFDETGQLTFSYYRERLVKNYRGMRWKGPVHEVIETRGHRVYADCAVTHWKLHPSELYYHQEYAQALAVFESFLSQGQGWVENQIDACRHCARCLYGLCRAEEALLAFFRSFSYDVPRAEICCDIGQHFLDREQWRQAAYWYRQALRCERQDDKGGFVLPDAYGYEPYLGLCLCSSRLGNEQEAEAYNELAAACKPDSPAIAYNRAYFASLKKT